MNQIPRTQIDEVLSLYKPECKYLKEAYASYPRAEGTFVLGPTHYTQMPLTHMTSIEGQLCLNQLLYAAFGRWVQEGRFPTIPLTYEHYLNLVKENMFIIETQIRFSEPISAAQPAIGHISLSRLRHRGNLVLAFVDHDIESGKAE